MQIPLIDLKRQYADIQEEVNKAVLQVLSDAQYILGENVRGFENEFADYIGSQYAISVGNGTDALVIALKALAIGAGDEVITTPFTFFATAESISSVGAVPVFVDVRCDTFNIDESLIEDKITSRTKAIMPVHIFGQPCEMDKIHAIAGKHGLYVIEDACQAVGATYQGKRVGTLSDIACFSFFPTKNLSCAGDGGMITTSNENLAKICKALRTHGSGQAGQQAYQVINGSTPDEIEEQPQDNTVYNPQKYYNYLIGHNSRLDEIQAAILRIKLAKLDSYNRTRRKTAAYYDEALAGSNLKIPTSVANTETACHLYMLQYDNRDRIIQSLADKGIATGIYYPIPLHLQKAYKDLGYKTGDLPVAEYLSYRTFAIPCFPELTDEEQAYIVSSLKEALQ